MALRCDLVADGGMRQHCGQVVGRRTPLALRARRRPLEPRRALRRAARGHLASARPTALALAACTVLTRRQKTHRMHLPSLRPLVPRTSNQNRVVISTRGRCQSTRGDVNSVTPPILRRYSADTPPILRRYSADTPPILQLEGPHLQQSSGKYPPSASRMVPCRMSADRTYFWLCRQRHSQHTTASRSHVPGCLRAVLVSIYQLFSNQAALVV